MNFFSDDCIQYYDVVTRELKKSQKQKANKFIENNCIINEGNGLFRVYPIRGYNKTTYTVDINNRDCNCQHATNQKRLGLTNITCSHIFAVIQYLRRKRNIEGGKI